MMVRRPIYYATRWKRLLFINWWGADLTKLRLGARSTSLALNCTNIKVLDGYDDVVHDQVAG